MSEPQTPATGGVTVLKFGLALAGLFLLFQLLTGGVAAVERFGRYAGMAVVAGLIALVAVAVARRLYLRASSRRTVGVVVATLVALVFGIAAPYYAAVGVGIVPEPITGSPSPASSCCSSS